MRRPHLFPRRPGLRRLFLLGGVAAGLAAVRNRALARNEVRYGLPPERSRPPSSTGLP